LYKTFNLYQRHFDRERIAMTQENDIVLIHIEDKPMAFARVEHITADHKKDWFQITLLVLGIPLKNVTWILREEYINGAEFTMDEKKTKLEKVINPEASSIPEPEKTKSEKPTSPATKNQNARVITFPGLPEKNSTPEDDGA